MAVGNPDFCGGNQKSVFRSWVELARGGSVIHHIEFSICPVKGVCLGWGGGGWPLPPALPVHCACTLPSPTNTIHRKLKFLSVCSLDTVPYPHITFNMWGGGGLGKLDGGKRSWIANIVKAAWTSSISTSFKPGYFSPVWLLHLIHLTKVKLNVYTLFFSQP